MLDEISLTINGKPFNVSSKSIPLDTNLNSFIRNQAHLTGTKFMCLEGGCGACIVNICGIHPVTGQTKSWAVNSCLMPIFSCHNLDVTTIEGIGNRKDGYHPAQKRLTEFNGTQCGYCSPGMVMNMYSLLESNNGKVTMEEIENSFGGNICRCTGYRPILDAFKSLACDADAKLTKNCTDIENLDQICSKTGSTCPKTCQMITKKNPCLTFSNGKSWHKVTTIEEIFNIFNQLHDGEEYMLVAGNTAHGVYRRSNSIKTFIDITSVLELLSHQLSKENLVIGASVNLTELMAILKEASKSTGFEYVTELIHHIDLIANVPVRNAGTIAGNLSIKHAFNEFPSDMFVILDAVDAKLIIAESSQQRSAISLVDYLKTNMTHKVIISITLPALNPAEYLFRTYKIMPRAQNAHAYVNAGFLIKMKMDGKVDTARICYGGISPEFTHATKTEILLKNKVLHTNETLQSALKSLSDEIQPDWHLPDASPDYRKQLVFGLFYKFVINSSPKDLVVAKYLSGGNILIRPPLSSGVQTFDTYEENWPLTQFVPKYEGLIQCSGESKYANDFPHLPNELWAAFVPATDVHAKVLAINVDDALNIPGVHYFFSAKDIPGENNFSVEMPDVEEIFLSTDSTILFHGQPLGIILADTIELANYAVKFVKITYEKNENVEIITNLRDALHKKNIKNRKPFEMNFCQGQCAHRPKGPWCHQNANLPKSHSQHNQLVSADATKSIKQITGEFLMGPQYHYTMETQTAICIPAEDGIDVHCASQWMDSVQTIISAALKIPHNAINMIFKRLGGGYGAKISRPPQIACAAALACQLTNRPIRFVMSMESNMSVVGKRNACLTKYRIDVDESGKIQSLHNQYYEDSGCDYNDDPTWSTTGAFRNCYINDAWTIDSELILTDTPSCTSCRAPGTTEGIAMIEQMMEHIARVTNQDPLNVRLANMSVDHKLRPMIENFLADNDFYKRKNEINEFNAKNRWTKRGIAIVPMQYTQYYGGTLPAYVAIYHTDGTVVVTHGGMEMGQGINTKVAQVTAHILGVPLKYVKIKECTNVLGANANISGGSMASEAVCHAVKLACEKILNRMKPIRDELDNPEWIDIVNACFRKDIDLTAKYMYKAADLKIYNIFGVSAAEVEIDVLTGTLQLRRVDILEDTGESLSPSVDIGQVEGSFIMGIGYWLSENLIYHPKTGELLTNRTWTYKPPGARDIPVDFRVTFLQKSSNESGGVLRSKATGEPPLCMSIVVLFALRHALESSRKDAGIEDVWFELDGPAPPDAILLKCNNLMESFKLN